ncbi:hypothetical protein KJ934_00775 [Patescibacteria group bacterium]|nr:hypothetical protein [Patescibacteria group bacterium]MBU4353545.1 hypothetical protein [Patescibacteria group bacterium]MBU4476840.1 hypothetical protein [Patescibacteria group bacterium]MCG2699286.1 hypothetical protein [Candidatus Parcubacteria bacterium]
MYTHCYAVKELAQQNAKKITHLANSFLEGHITEKELCCDMEFQSLLFLKKIKQLNENRKGA